MIGQIENAIIARIKAASDGDALGYKLRKVDAYSGQFEADEFAQVAAQFPMVLVAYIGDWKAPERRAGGRQIFPQISVLTAASHMRNQAAARQGSDEKVGSTQICADMRQLLTEQTLGLEIDPLFPTGAELLINSTTRDRYASVIAMELQTGFFEPSRKPVGQDGDFATFFAQWDLPPFAAAPDPPQPLPRPAGDVDSEQTVSLPTA